MVNLTNFIFEKLSTIDSKYGVELMLLDNDTKCKGLSIDEFVKALEADINKAVKLYDSEVQPELEAEKEESKNKLIAKAVEYAEAKWKRKSKQTEYIEKAKEQIEKNSYIPTDKITNFSTNLPGDGWTSSYYTIQAYAYGPYLRQFANKLVEAKIYDLIDGWIISYPPTSENSQRIKPASYARITFKLPTELQDKIDAGAHNLADALDEYYRTAENTGD